MKLTNIDAVSLLDKRGYLTICISQKTDGRVYLRLQEGIRDWFYHIQTTVYESKRRRKFWVKGPSYAGLTNNRLARLYGEKMLFHVFTISVGPPKLAYLSFLSAFPLFSILCRFRLG